MSSNGTGLSRRLQRGQRILDNLSSNAVISSDSRNFLLAALDPYHDSEFPVPIGYPDGCTERSVVRCINMSTTISCPSSITGDWSCILSTNPFLNSLTQRATKFPNNSRHNTTIIEWDGVTEGYVDGSVATQFINIDSYEGEQTDQWGDVNRDTAAANTGFVVESRFLQGVGRIIGFGLEVHNVTPDLYKGGTVTVGEMPQASHTMYPLNMLYKQPVTDGTGTTYSNLIESVKPMASRPDSLYDAMQYPGSRQWEAKDGVYMVVPLTTIENEPLAAEYVYPMVHKSSERENTDTRNTSSVMVTPTEAGTVIGQARELPHPMKWAPLVSKFAYFTGLAKETKLTVNVRVFYESFPTTADRDILPLATPSPDIDTHALALYQHCMTHLPIAVPVGENGLGEWFAQAVSEFSDVVGLGLSAMGVPFASQMASGAKMIANDYLKAQASKNKPRAKKAAPAPPLAIKNKKRKQKRKNTSGGVTTPLRRP